MRTVSRRNFMRQGAIGLAVVGAGELILRAEARPTPAIASPDDAQHVPIQMGPPAKDAPVAKGELRKLTPVGAGPWYKPGAPFRAKLSTPFEPGTTFVMSGRVWGYDTKRPLPGALLDVWHVDVNERYSDGVTDFRNRGRLITSETGAYEFESIRPIPYRPNPTGAPAFYRCAHFHVLVTCPGYRQLITEIHFKDDPKKDDPMYRPENAVAVEKRLVNGREIESVVFDIVLDRESGSK